MKGTWASWRTLIAGILLAGGILIEEAKTLFDNDPATNPRWEIVTSALGALGFGWFARDDAVSSEAAGVARH